MAHHSVQIVISHCGAPTLNGNRRSTTDFRSAQVFSVRAETRFGQSIRVVGDSDEPLWHALGNVRVCSVCTSVLLWQCCVDVGAP